MSEQISDPLSFGERVAGVVYRRRPGAYAVILAPDGKVALVQGKGDFHLPGGGLEPGEDALTALHRETREETGLVIEDPTWLGAADQILSPTGGTAWVKACTYYLVTRYQEGSDITPPEHELSWATPADAAERLLHESHAWAVKRAQPGRVARPRVQAIVVRGDRVLMVRHCIAEKGWDWWCLPGGAREPGESSEEGALRELREECNVNGVAVRQTSHVSYGPDDETISFLVEIGEQEPSLGCDPEMPTGSEVLREVRWRKLAEVAERDRAYLWAAGLLGVGPFAAEVDGWGSDTSYPC